MSEFQPQSANNSLEHDEYEDFSRAMLEVLPHPDNNEKNEKNEKYKKYKKVLLQANYLNDDGEKVEWKHSISQASFLHIGKTATGPKELEPIDKSKLYGEARNTRELQEANNKASILNARQRALDYTLGMLSQVTEEMGKDAKAQIIDQLIDSAQAAHKALEEAGQ